MLRDGLEGRGVGAGGNMGEVASGVFRKLGQLRLKPLISGFQDQALYKILITLQKFEQSQTRIDTKF
jgi:hypothetical protein